MEVTSRTLEKILGLVSKTQEDWDINLAYVEFVYNQSPAFTTGYSSFEVVYGVNPYFPLDLILLPKEELVQKDIEAKLKSMMKWH